jgi:hypothetical protein
VRNLLLGSLDQQPRDDAWVKRLKRYRRAWYMLMAAIVLGVLVLMVQQNFSVNPLILFGVVAVGLLTFIVAEGIDSRILLYESDRLIGAVSDEEARIRFAQIGFNDDRREPVDNANA